MSRAVKSGEVRAGEWESRQTTRNRSRPVTERPPAGRCGGGRSSARRGQRLVGKDRSRHMQVEPKNDEQLARARASVLPEPHFFCGLCYPSRSHTPRSYGKRSHPEKKREPQGAQIKVESATLNGNDSGKDGDQQKQHEQTLKIG